MANFLALIIFVTSIYAAKSACPDDGKTTEDGKCLWVVSVEADARLHNHDRAAQACETAGGKLPSIKMPQKEAQMRELANAKRSALTENNNAVYVWINLRRDELPADADKTDLTLWKQRDAWKWKDDESGISEEMWRFWNTEGNEPNNYDQIDEYCAVATVKADGESTWNDATCSNDRWYDGATAYATVIMCEKPTTE